MIYSSLEKKLISKVYYSLFGLIIVPNILLSITNNTTFVQSVKLFIFIILLYYYFKLYINRMLTLPKGISKLFFLSLFFLSLLIIIRGKWPPLYSHKFYLKLMSRETLSYLLPFVLLPISNSIYKDNILQILFRCSLFIIPIWLLNINGLVQELWHGESIGVYLPFLSVFLLGFPYNFTNKQRKINLSIAFIFFILMILNARRNVLFSVFLYFFSYFFLYKIYFNRNKIIHIIISFLGLIMFFQVSFFLSDKMFIRLNSRINEDTRSGVERLFFSDFNNAPIEEWIYGRGLDGGYYQEICNVDTNEIETNRTVIETGYLNMLLHGGIIYLFFVYGLFFIAVVNIAGKRKVFYHFIFLIMLTFLIDSYTTNIVNIFGVRSIIFWFCISLGLSSNKKQYLDKLA